MAPRGLAARAEPAGAARDLLHCLALLPDRLSSTAVLRDLGFPPRRLGLLLVLSCLPLEAVNAVQHGQKNG